MNFRLLPHCVAGLVDSRSLRLIFVIRSSISAFCLWSLWAVPLFADHVSYRDSSGQKIDTEARIVASEQGVSILELASGEYRLIATPAILDRRPQEGPHILTSSELCEQLCSQFPTGRTRSLTLDQYAVVVILGTSLEKRHETRVQSILNKATRFMKNVETVYGNFCKQAKLNVQPPRLPLGMLIFETERDFDEYAGKVTGRGVSSAATISGFYSGLTNLLAIRLSECLTFEVPAHEAIHQQSYNRGTFQRLAPIPHWLDEGMATGFETIGAKISGSPFRISTRYARQALDSDALSWNRMLAEDAVFLGDVLAGEAYGQAWGLHWLLVTKHKKGYLKYLQVMAAKTPLQKETADVRLRDFTEAFNKTPDEIEPEFLPVLNSAYQNVKARKQERDHNPSPGTLHLNSGLAEIEVVGEQSPLPSGRLFVRGRLRNASPIRPMSYYVFVETDTGSYTAWHLPEVPVDEVVELGQKPVDRRQTGLPSFVPGTSFSIKVRSTTPDSPEAEAWKRGEFPHPGLLNNH